jgi:hypothetical protein
MGEPRGGQRNEIELTDRLLESYRPALVFKNFVSTFANLNLKLDIIISDDSKKKSTPSTYHMMANTSWLGAKTFQLLSMILSAARR